jgi:hypothetical protein
MLAIGRGVDGSIRRPSNALGSVVAARPDPDLDDATRERRGTAPGVTDEHQAIAYLPPFGAYEMQQLVSSTQLTNGAAKRDPFVVASLGDTVLRAVLCAVNGKPPAI